MDSGYGTGAHASLKFSSSGNPAIAYHWEGSYGGPGQLRYAAFNGTAWDVKIIDSLGGLYPSLAFDLSGTPCISYYVDENLKYAYWNGISWDIEVVDDQGNVGEYNSLALDSQGNPAISYYDTTNGQLKFAAIPQNHPPDALNVHIITIDGTTNQEVSREPITGDRLKAAYTFHDIDGDPEAGSVIVWYKNGIVVPGEQNLLLSCTVYEGEMWSFSITPSDGKSSGITRVSSTVTVAPGTRIITVDDDLVDLPDADFTTIQDAIDAANPGDTVIVFDGIYTGYRNRNLDFGGKDITVKSQNGPENTIIDCESDGRGFYFHSGETLEAVVDGFAIRNGNANGGGAILCGDNLGNSSPTIINNIIEGCSGGSGGGGGIHLYSESSPLLKNNIIRNNYTSAAGGAIYCTHQASPDMKNNIITDNRADRFGGGIVCSAYSTSVLANNIIARNTAGEHAGAIYFDRYSTVTLVNNTITDNHATYGSGLYCFNITSLTIVNTILWNNGQDELSGHTSVVDITYSDIQGGWTGEGNIDTDPSFEDAPNGDYHLGDDSFCIGAGTKMDAPTTDIEGHPRPNPDNSNPDMGAYENPLGSPIGANGTIAGTVTDSSTGNPIESATVSADGYLTTTDSEGDYQLYIPAGTYDVTVSAFGYLPQTKSITVVAGQTTTLDFSVEEDLLQKYAPVFYLHEQEEFYPWGIESMLDKAELWKTKWLGTRREKIADPPITISGLMENNTANHYLDLQGYGTELPPTKEVWSEYNEYFIYGRRYEDEIDHPGKVILQYWIFYPFNYWQVFDDHEGDWEVVQIECSKVWGPIILLSSHHHSVSIEPWSEVEKIEQTHPKIFVARGGHGNWPDNGSDGLHYVGDRCEHSLYDVTSEDGLALHPKGLLSSVDEYNLADITQVHSWPYWIGKWGNAYALRFWNEGPEGLSLRDEWWDPFGYGETASLFWACLGSPAHLHVYDFYGNHVGLNETGEVEATIPGTHFYIPSFDSETSSESLWITTSEELIFMIEAIGSGSFDFNLGVYDREEDVRVQVEYRDIQIIEDSVATVELISENPTFIMEMDFDGDGITDDYRHANYLDLVADVQATIDIDPDSLNLGSQGKWGTCYIELPEEYDVSNIQIDTIELMMGENVVTQVAQSSPNTVGDYNGNGITDLMVKFDRPTIIAYLKENSITSGQVDLRIIGQVDSEVFDGSDTVTVIDGEETAPPVPTEFALCQNFSNPFNPDTWIPFQLAEDADVAIRIYDAAGRLVRTLNLGHKPAGFYMTREKAAYWDGRNEAGEGVASGIYFYTIQAGEFTATRKMAVTR